MNNNCNDPKSNKKKAAASAATVSPSDKVRVIIGDIKYLTPESLAILKQRGQEWYDRRLLVESDMSRDGEESKIGISSSQVAGLLKIEMHLASDILMVAAKVLGIDSGDAVTVKQFCHLFNLNEEKVRPAIQKISHENSIMLEIFNTPEARAQAEKSKKKALESIAKLEPSEKVYAVINGLEFLTAETIEILKQRAMAWFDKWPIGEPMYCRNDRYKFNITSNQVAFLVQIDVRTAQEVLYDFRILLGKSKGAIITVKEFCFLAEVDEDDCRRALQDIAPDYSIN